jgi:hypothetical protein
MFLILLTIFVANICLVPYYFIEYVEYFLINGMIPIINNIYSLRNKKRILEIKVYNGVPRIDLFSSDSSDDDIQNRINEISQKILLFNGILLNSYEITSEDSDMPDLVSISSDSEDIFRENQDYYDTEDDETEDEQETEELEDDTEEELETEDNKNNDDIIIIEDVD